MAKLSWLDACKHWQAIHWSGVQAPGDNAQGAIQCNVNKAGMSTATPSCSTVLLLRQGQGDGAQCLSTSTHPEPASRLSNATREVNFFAKSQAGVGT